MIITIIITPITSPITSPYRALGSWGSENIPKHFSYKRQHEIPQNRTMTHWMTENVHKRQDDDSLNDWKCT
jgi:hypothetical protein